ncbi:MAG: transketolase [Propionibacteriaceae bacterium]|jgi:transketolase|nr:transketolase [Propionibacteriaceae bacterium]
MSLSWSDLDARAVDTARVLAADAVEKVGNGHPGTAISVAPLAYLLYQKVMRHDPAEPRWLGRDRFVLSIGHSSLTQYTQLCLAGYGIAVEDFAHFRTWGALLPGHPEVGHTPGVECTTGPLGAGISNGVGFAMAARRAHALYDPDAGPGQSVFDHDVYVICGDGDLQEGISSEACSLAGTLELGNLTVLYDDNHISIEGDTAIAFSEDVDARFAAYGWHVQHVDFTHGGPDGAQYEEKVADLFEAIEQAKQVTDRPSLIRVTTVIGWPLPNKAGSHTVHGAKLGADEVAALKVRLGFDPAQSFQVDPAVLAHTRANAQARAAAARADWDPKFAAWAAAHPDKKALLDRVLAQEPIPGLDDALPVFAPGKKSTRAASGEVLTALAGAVPELWGGSADLAGSNNTTMKGAPSFLPADRVTSDWPGGDDGRVIHFGIREHAMGGILNAIALDGLTRAYGGTFLVFADYMRGAVRVAALSHAPAIFVWSHDSIGVGEDGPTHQPVEQIASLRLIPGLDVVRPADANETAVCWAKILGLHDHPAAIILSRQDLPIVDRSEGSGFAPAADAARGAYTLADATGGAPAVVLVATGSEVAVAVAARAALEAEGIPTRVVSAPCLEWFFSQTASYQAKVLPESAVKVSIEAGVTYGWAEIVSSRGRRIGVDRFGASAAAEKLFVEYGITPDHVVAEAKAALAERD